MRARTTNVLQIKPGRRRWAPACRPTRRPDTRRRIRSRRRAGAGAVARWVRGGAAPRPSGTCCSCTGVRPARRASGLRGGLPRDQAGRRQQVLIALSGRRAGRCLPGATRLRGQENPRLRISPIGRPLGSWPTRKSRRAPILDPPAGQAGRRPQHRNAQRHMRAQRGRGGQWVGERLPFGQKKRRMPATSCRPPIATGWHHELLP